MTIDNLMRYGFNNVEELEAELARLEKKIEQADDLNDEAWIAYNRRVEMKADVTIAAKLIETTAQKIDELTKKREELEATLEEWGRDEVRREQREEERFLRR